MDLNLDSTMTQPMAENFIKIKLMNLITDLSDEQILMQLPKITGQSQNVQNLKECLFCPRVAPNGCQGYCAMHFCDLYRKGQIYLAPNRENGFKVGLLFVI